MAEVSQNDLAPEIFPNPAGNFINLFIPPVNSSNFTVRLTDQMGKTVFTQQNVQPTILYTFDMSAIPAGMYVMHIKNEAITWSQKVALVK